MTRRTLSFSVFQGSTRDWDGSSSSWTLDEFLALLQAARAEIPEDCRSVATVELELESDYDSFGPATLTVSYDRPETEHEEASRLTEEKTREEMSRADTLRREREMYERLRGKFGE